MKKKSKENCIKRAWRRTVYAFKRVFGWIRRMVFGSAKDYDEIAIESPSRLLREAFFRKKSAVVALVVLLGLFLFVFIAPAFVSLDINYTDPLHTGRRLPSQGP